MVIALKARATMLLLVGSACGRAGFSPSGPGDAGPDAEIVAMCGPQTALTDEFLDGPAGPTFTSFENPGLTVAEVTGRLRITFGASVASGHYAGYESRVTYPLDGVCAIAKLTEVPAGQGNVYFKVTAPSGEQLEFLESDQLLKLRIHSGPTGADIANVGMTSFSLPEMTYWRIRQQAGTSYWDVSADGVSYTVVAAKSGFLAATDVTIQLGAGAESAATNAGLGEFDSVSVNTP